MRNLLKAWPFLALIGACSPSLEPSAPIPALPSVGPVPPPCSGNSCEKQILTQQPCTYWNSIPNAAATDVAFQVIDQPAQGTSTDPKTGAKTTVIVAHHNLSFLPQARYKLSTEGMSPADIQYHRTLDPMSLLVFLQMAKDRSDGTDTNPHHYISPVTYGLAQTAYDLGLYSTLVTQRNQNMVLGAEELLPGIFTSNAGTTEEDQLLYMYEKSVGISLPDANVTTGAGFNGYVLPLSYISVMAPLARRVPLFPASDWESRRQDIQTAMATLESTAALTNLPLDQATCRFAISQRVTAQLLSLKGFAGSPQLQSNGMLVPIPNVETTTFPRVDELGMFGNVATTIFISSQVATPTMRVTGASDTEGILSAIRYFIELDAHRTSDLWTTNPDPTQAPLGQVKLDARLLQLGIGTFGIQAGVFKAQELHLTAEDGIHLNDDTADNLAILGNLALEAVDAFQSLNTPNTLESTILTAPQLASFTDPTTGVVYQFSELITGVIFEGLSRIQNGQGSPNLVATLKLIGQRIGNTDLQNLP